MFLGEYFISSNSFQFLGGAGGVSDSFLIKLLLEQTSPTKTPTFNAKRNIY